MDTKVFDEKVHQRNKEQGRSNYVRGMAYEFVVLKREKKHSLFAMRSAGSHTLIDIVAVRRDETRLISCRVNGTWISKETDDLVALQNELPEGHNVYLAYQDKTLAKKDMMVKLNEV